MNESTLKDFFLGNIKASILAQEVDQSLRQDDEITIIVQIHKMDNDFDLTREMIVNLCTAVLNNELPAQYLKPIAFVLIASDYFKWHDDVIGNVIHDLAAPEVNYQLTPHNIEFFREYLLGKRTYPLKPQMVKSTEYLLISRMKTEFV